MGKWCSERWRLGAPVAVGGNLDLPHAVASRCGCPMCSVCSKCWSRRPAYDRRPRPPGGRRRAHARDRWPPAPRPRPRRLGARPPSPGISRMAGTPGEGRVREQAAQGRRRRWCPGRCSRGGPGWRRARTLESLRCTQHRRSRPTTASKRGHHVVRLVQGGEVDARRPQVLGVEADTRGRSHPWPLRRRGDHLDDGGQLLEGAPDRVAGPGGVLEHQGARPRSAADRPGRRPASRRPPGARLALEAAPPVAADVEHQAPGPHGRGHGEVGLEAGTRAGQRRRRRVRPG